MSGGEYISLGHEEQKDLVVVLRHLRKTGLVSSIALWGRSMGAATAILRAAKDHCIAACVLDSPFGNLRQLMEEVVGRTLHLPSFLADMAIETVRSEVCARASFDLNDVAPLSSAPKANCPAFFGAALDDELVLPHHTKDLHAAWGGDACMHMFKGGHNGERPRWYINHAVEFLVNNFQSWAGGYETIPLNTHREALPCSIPPRLHAQSSSASDLACLAEDAWLKMQLQCSSSASDSLCLAEGSESNQVGKSDLFSGRVAESDPGPEASSHRNKLKNAAQRIEFVSSSKGSPVSNQRTFPESFPHRNFAHSSSASDLAALLEENPARADTS